MKSPDFIAAMVGVQAVLPMEVFTKPMSWLTHLPQIFGISDLIIVMVCVVAIGLGILSASRYSRASYERIKSHRLPSEETVLNAVDVFEQLNGGSRFQHTDISGRYIGTESRWSGG